jgi:hypothetical protein
VLRAGWQGDPLTDPLARDHVARDFRRYLQASDGPLGDHHQVVAAAHQPGQTGVAQRVRGQLQTRAGGDEPHVEDLQID